MTILIYLVEKYPNKDWGIRGLSLHSAITPKFIKKHIDKDWGLALGTIWVIKKQCKITPELVEKCINRIGIGDV